MKQGIHSKNQTQLHKIIHSPTRFDHVGVIIRLVSRKFQRKYAYVRRTKKDAHIFHYCFKSITLSSTRFEQLSVHHQEDWTGSFIVLYRASIQGVPGGMDKTSGECSLC